MHLNWLGSLIIFSISVLMFILPRHYTLVPIMAMCCYMTFGQQLVIEGLNWNGLRIIILSGYIRIIIRREAIPLRLNIIDRTIILWMVVNVVAYTLLHWTIGALINRLGVAFDNLGLFFFFRMTIRDIKDMERSIGIIAIVIAPLAAAMVVELITGKNPFAYLGGVSENVTIRNGRLRCQGPFKHPILAGTFGATLIPLFVGYWVRRTKNKILAGVGLISATAITLASGSSGALVSYMTGVGVLCLWPFRRRMRMIRWGGLSLIILLQLFMNDPIWYLSDRIGHMIGRGGAGWHRAFLIDQTVRHFDRWWLQERHKPKISWHIPYTYSQAKLMSPTNLSLKGLTEVSLPCSCL